MFRSLYPPRHRFVAYKNHSKSLYLPEVQQLVTLSLWTGNIPCETFFENVESTFYYLVNIPSISCVFGMVLTDEPFTPSREV